ncbi:MAG: Maf family nucleotide pyrophosphatase [Cyclobacteriaceae bacterium]
MTQSIILASSSEIRAQLLRQAQVDFSTEKARVDEEMIRESLLVEQAKPRDIADTLAEMKARKVSDKNPGSLVIGCDQVLEHRGELLSKPNSPEDALKQLRLICGDRHTLMSAVVIYEDGKPIWRHVGTVRLRMHEVPETYLSDYVTRNWASIRHSVGGHKLEEEGVRLFSRIDGDYFTVLGLPLLELLSYLALRGDVKR